MRNRQPRLTFSRSEPLNKQCSIEPRLVLESLISRMAVIRSPEHTGHMHTDLMRLFRGVSERKVTLGFQLQDSQGSCHTHSSPCTAPTLSQSTKIQGNFYFQFSSRNLLWFFMLLVLFLFFFLNTLFHSSCLVAGAAGFLVLKRCQQR